MENNEVKNINKYIILGIGLILILGTVIVCLLLNYKAQEYGNTTTTITTSSSQTKKSIQTILSLYYMTIFKIVSYFLIFWNKS